ncbi:hypothetical protein GCM10018793_70540 [Streptomyces sulfonofaciens]|uniref:Uncharacterized protein n=1 Tax=Streptomyces sulfonofaciens TaxID=68272 RepID=A0A919GSC2_9ACTN|nr:hypothetical protein [Streptomyces sulfonofaciens]GHH88966.1 hypothetical protein GCM10018793_70540 [Streptomyces sulfonofaciens]
MPSDIFIPGDELDAARQALGFVHDNIDIGHHTFDFEKAFGPELAGHGSAQNFENKWQDGKQQLRKQVEDLKKAMDSIMDSFTKTDNDAVANLDDGAGGGR